MNKLKTGDIIKKPDPAMTSEQIEALWLENVAEMAKMENAAASLVRAVMLCAERNGAAYIRLKNAEATRAEYEHVQGDPDLIKHCAKYLGAYCGDRFIGTL